MPLTVANTNICRAFLHLKFLQGLAAVADVCVIVDQDGRSLLFADDFPVFVQGYRPI